MSFYVSSFFLNHVLFCHFKTRISKSPKTLSAGVSRQRKWMDGISKLYLHLIQVSTCCWNCTHRWPGASPGQSGLTCLLRLLSHSWSFHARCCSRAAWLRLIFCLASLCVRHRSSMGLSNGFGHFLPRGVAMSRWGWSSARVKGKCCRENCYHGE